MKALFERMFTELHGVGRAELVVDLLAELNAQRPDVLAIDHANPTTLTAVVEQIVETLIGG